MPAAAAACAALLCPAGAVFEGTVATRINSRIHRLRCGDRRIAVKECRGPPGGHGTHAAREFAVLQQLWERSAHAEHGPLAPRPLVLCNDAQAYGMAWVDGATLTQRILAGGAEAAARDAALAGRWLRRFHALEAEPPRAHDFHARLPLLREERRRRARDAGVASAIDVLERHVDRVAAVATPASWIHGDMKSDNLLVEGDRIVGLDVQAVDRNTVVYDLAPFRNHLRLLRWSPKGALRGAALERAGDAFLEAYAPDAPGWRAPVAWLQAYLLIQQLPIPGAKGWRSRVNGVAVRHSLRLVLRELDAARVQA